MTVSASVGGDSSQLRKNAATSAKGPARSASGSERARTATRASLEHALLGLIAEHAPVSGYDLLKTFRTSMVHYWHVQQGQIYPTLERMERAGWIESREVIQRRRPNKRLYSVTPAGKRVLVEWLESPFEPLKLKHAPLLRIRFLGQLPPDRAREKLAEARAMAARYLEVLRGYERDIAARGGPYRDANTMFVYFTLKRGISSVESEMEFYDWVSAEIERSRKRLGTSARSRPSAHPGIQQVR